MDGVNNFSFTSNLAARLIPSNAEFSTQTANPSDNSANQKRRGKAEQLSEVNETMPDRALINHFKQAVSGILLSEDREDLLNSHGLGYKNGLVSSGYEKSSNRIGFNSHQGNVLVTNEFKDFSESYSMLFKTEKAIADDQADRLLLKIDSMTRITAEDKKTGEAASEQTFDFSSDPVLELKGSKDKNNPNLTDHLIKILLSSNNDPDGGIPVKDSPAPVLDLTARLNQQNLNRFRRAA